jgi:hypothetical protein
MEMTDIRVKEKEDEYLNCNTRYKKYKKARVISHYYLSFKYIDFKYFSERTI